MITYVEGDLFQSPAKVLVNAVNTVGVMGKGIAQEFKRIYPDMFRRYQELCEKGRFNIGELWLYKTSHKWILNFPTKRHWSHKSQPEYIEAGLDKFVASYAQKDITSISFPMLGCGNGELDWETQVRPLMERYLKKLPITIYVHIYQKEAIVPEHRNAERIREWLRGEPQHLAFGEFWDDLQQLINSRQVFHLKDSSLPFRVQVTQNPEGIVILDEHSQAHFIAKEENGLLDLWQYIRASGYCLPGKLPLDIGPAIPYLVSFLSELQYIRLVRLSLIDEPAQIGIQLVAPKSEDEIQPTPLSVTPILPT